MPGKKIELAMQMNGYKYYMTTNTFGRVTQSNNMLVKIFCQVELIAV